jgi:glycine/sarcosine N-methyltransferase
MDQASNEFYDQMATAYHLIFDDWGASIERQRIVLSNFPPAPSEAGVVLDCACGIGTQAIGLAQAGYLVEATDLSASAIERAKKEASLRGLAIQFRVDDMRLLTTSLKGKFGAVVALDNALPHLDSDDDEIQSALLAMRDRLKPQGVLLISLRDYEAVMKQRPAVTEPARFLDKGRRRIVHQIWDWQDDRRYVVHLYITRELDDGKWAVNHFTGRYRAITPNEVAAHAARAGFREVTVLQAEDTGYDQPIVKACSST